MSGRARNATASRSVGGGFQPFVFTPGVEPLVNPVTGWIGIVNSGVPGSHERLREATSASSEAYAALFAVEARGSMAPSKISGYVMANCMRYGSCARNAVRFVAKSRQNWLKRSTCVAVANWLYVKRFPSRGDRYVV